MSGAEPAKRPDSLQRAGALGLMRRLLAMDVVDAEGLDDGAVGEDRTEGKRTNVTSNNDTKDQDGCFTLKMTRTLFHLEPLSVVCPHWKCADDAPWCSHEKKCACARVR